MKRKKKIMKPKKYLLPLCGFWALLLMLSVPASAQTTVGLEDYEIRSRVFTAYVTDTPGTAPTAVTIALNVENMSSGHLDWYSVSGWYQRDAGLDQPQPRIPLVGIYTGNLTLYRFDNEALIDSIVNFGYDDYDRYSFMDMMERYHSMDGYLEKITFGQTEGAPQGGGSQQGEWVDGDTVRSIEVYAPDMNVLEYRSVLQIHHNDQDIRLALDRLGLQLPRIYPGEYTVEGYKEDGGKLRIVLSYQRASRGYVLGMCGAGTETGFLGIEMDGEGRVTGLQDCVVESCLGNISYEMGYHDDHEVNYIVTDGEGFGWFLTFFRDSMTLEWAPGG